MINSNREYKSVIYKHPNSGYYLVDESAVNLVISHLTCDGKRLPLDDKSYLQRESGRKMFFFHVLHDQTNVFQLIAIYEVKVFIATQQF